MDLYHAQIVEGDLTTKIRRWLPHIGHFQIAGVPGAQRAQHGRAQLRLPVQAPRRAEVRRLVGCEYRPARTTAAGLGWLYKLIDRRPDRLAEPTLPQDLADVTSTLNVTNNNPNQIGFNRTTQYATDSNAGTIWRTGDPANGVSPLNDPFPLRANGTRFDTSTNGALGMDTLAGRSYTFWDYPTRRAHQHRWRLGIQRQIRQNVISVTYTGSYSRDVYVDFNLNSVP